MLVGAAQVNITPELPFAMHGHYYLRMGKQVLDPLYASSVVIDNGDNNVVALISCDLIHLQDEAISFVKGMIHQEIGINPNHIIITTTHTHQGPLMDSKDKNVLSWSQRDERKYTRLLQGIVTSVLEAFAHRKPARMGYGKGQVEKCGFNRRYIMSHGKSEMNPKRGHNPDRLMVEGPVDQEVQVIWYEDLAGEHLAYVIHFTSHPITLIGTDFISGDFVGAMRKDIQLLNGQVPVLFLQGAAGNIDTYDFEQDEEWGDGLDGYYRIGRILAGEVVKIISSHRVQDESQGEFVVKNQTVHLPYKEVSEQEVARVSNIWESLSTEEREKLPFEEKVYVIRLLQLAQLRKKQPAQSVELTLLKWGSFILVTVPGELFVEYQIKFKQRMRDFQVLVLGYANGSVGYLPTKQAMALGGYEAVSSNFSPEAGSLIYHAWIQLLDSCTK